MDAWRIRPPWGGWCRLSSSRKRSRETSSCSSRMAWSRPVLVRRRVGVVGAGPWGRGAAAGAEVGDGLIVELSGCCSEICFRPSNSEPGMAILAVSACSRRKLGALCWRGLSWVQGCLWARLLGVLDSEALLGTRGSRVCGWEAASWGTGAVEGWANVPGVLRERHAEATERGHGLQVPPHAKPKSS